MAEIPMYFPILSVTAEEMINRIEESKDEDLTIRMSTPGGSVASGWGIAAKLKEFENNVTIKVDGMAASMGFVLLMYADQVEALDVSRLMVHRADMVVDTEEERKILETVNQELKSKLKKKVDNKKFKEITGYSIDQVFDSSKERVNVWISGKQAEQLGIVDKINNLDPKNSSAKALQQLDVAANYEGTDVYAWKEPEEEPTNKEETSSNHQNLENMDYKNLKAQYPELFNQIKDEGKNEGIEQERERVKSCLTFVEADQKEVVRMINEGEELKQSKQVELQNKLLALNAKGQIQNDSAGDANPENAEEEPQSEEEKVVNDYVSDAKKQLTNQS